MNEKTGRFIAEKLGKLIAIDDTGRDSGVVTEFLRVWLMVDITKPLLKGFFMCKAGKPDTWATFQYERLSDFCYNCGIIGHSHTECKEECGEKNNTQHFSQELRAVNDRAIPPETEKY